LLRRIPLADVALRLRQLEAHRTFGLAALRQAAPNRRKRKVAMGGRIGGGSGKPRALGGMESRGDFFSGDGRGVGGDRGGECRRARCGKKRLREAFGERSRSPGSGWATHGGAASAFDKGHGLATSVQPRRPRRDVVSGASERRIRIYFVRVSPIGKRAVAGGELEMIGGGEKC